MINDFEKKTIMAMTNAIMDALHDSGLNPMQAMLLVGYAARQVVWDISSAMLLDPKQAIITSLGAMLPEDYIKALTSPAQPKQPSNGCGGSM